MLINWTTKIEGSRVILVPYCKHHVPKYHEWMKNEDLQHLTGSEPLSLDEEFQMQETWRDSADKCTFIVLSKGNIESQSNEIGRMVGDTNIFLRSDDDTGKTIGEVEIMIAESSARRQKLGWESMALMLRFGIQVLKIEEFEAKIKMDNPSSIAMFQKLQFVESERSCVFQEITFRAVPTDEWKTFIFQQTSEFKILDYPQL